MTYQAWYEHFTQHLLFASGAALHGKLDEEHFRGIYSHTYKTILG